MCTGTLYAPRLMIRRFRHRGLKRMYERSDPSRVGPDLADRVALALPTLTMPASPRTSTCPATGFTG